MGLFTASPKQHARRLKAIRAAAAKGDVGGVKKHLDREHLGGVVLDRGFTIELLVEAYPSFAGALWEVGLDYVHAWQPLAIELVERQDYDPFAIVETSLSTTLRGGHSPVPFAVATMLLRMERREAAQEIAERWISDPLERSAMDLALCEDPHHRLRLRDAMRRSFVDAGAPHEASPLLVSCEALCEADPEHLPRMLTNLGLTPLNTPLISDVPREAEGPRGLYLARTHDDRQVVWSFVVAESDSEAERWGSAVVAEADGIEVRRLYDVQAHRSGFSFPPSMQRYIVDREVSGVGWRSCCDQTGLARHRVFYESLAMTAADLGGTWPPARDEAKDRDWPIPPPESVLADHHQRAVASGLFE